MSRHSFGKGRSRQNDPSHVDGPTNFVAPQQLVEVPTADCTAVEPNHATDQQLGGKAKQKRRLNVIRVRPGETGPLWADVAGFKPVAGVPKSRAECPDTSKGPCCFVRCRMHLYRVDGGDRPGRPGLSSVPRDAQGRTLSAIGDVGGKPAPTTLDAAAWLRWDSARPSCALQIAEMTAARHEEMSNAELGELFGDYRTTAARITKRALRSFIAKGGTLEGLRALIEQERERAMKGKL